MLLELVGNFWQIIFFLTMLNYQNFSKEQTNIYSPFIGKILQLQDGIHSQNQRDTQNNRYLGVSIIFFRTRNSSAQLLFFII